MLISSSKNITKVTKPHKTFGRTSAAIFLLGTFGTVERCVRFDDHAIALDVGKDEESPSLNDVSFGCSERPRGSGGRRA